MLISLSEIKLIIFVFKKFSIISSTFVGCSFINTRVDKKLDNVEEVKPVLAKFGDMDEVAGLKIVRKDFKDGVKLYLEDNKSWVLVRPSGTEPLLRIYMESDSQEKIDKIISFVN